MNQIDEKRYLLMMNQWFILKQKNGSIITYLYNKGINSVAVYGMGVYGRHLVREFQGTSISLIYAIDRMGGESFMGIPIIKPNDEMSKVDAIINTIIYDHENVCRTLKQKTDIAILNLEDIIFESCNVGL